MPRYAPGYGFKVAQPRKRVDEEEPVEDFRQTMDMKGFSAMFKKILGLSDYLQQGVASAAAEYQRRRNLFGGAIGALLNLSNRAPNQRLQPPFGQGFSEDFEESSGEVTRRATARSEEEPFSVGNIMTTIGERGVMPERAYKLRR